MRVENERIVNKDLPYLRQQAHDNLQCISNKTTRKILTLYGWGISNNGYHNNNKENGRNDNNSNITMTKSNNKTRLQALVSSMIATNPKWI